MARGAQRTIQGEMQCTARNSQFLVAILAFLFLGPSSDQIVAELSDESTLKRCSDSSHARFANAVSQALSMIEVSTSRMPMVHY